MGIILWPIFSLIWELIKFLYAIVLSAYYTIFKTLPYFLWFILQLIWSFDFEYSSICFKLNIRHLILPAQANDDEYSYFPSPYTEVYGKRMLVFDTPYHYVWNIENSKVK